MTIPVGENARCLNGLELQQSKGTPASAWPVKGSIAYHHSLFQKGTPQKRKNQGETLLSFNPTAKAAWRIRVVFRRNDVAGWLSGELRTA
ncbi:conserved hypothetical protein [Coccidioides posadasii str. Silveira]|uniref:Uncharacterized protein n=1 Tax=Coccidioides posadasii (strain RMSCC 757 / Silveira) TaxID=443226 RepID=E9DAG3_COCPS|nr:conserved hypothetical protein [Coccidioides posadasii str. Silveira]